MYDINKLREKEFFFKEECKEHFVKFFQDFGYTKMDQSKIRITKIFTHNCISKLRYGSGLYLILTDYIENENQCLFVYEGLKCIYRGHGVRMRKRLESHLFNKQYNEKKDGTSYSVCMKLNSDNGINIDEKPYSDFSWAVIQHPMTKSSKTMREQAEQAFDTVYKMPIGSNA